MAFRTIIDVVCEVAVSSIGALIRSGQKWDLWFQSLPVVEHSATHLFARCKGVSAINSDGLAVDVRVAGNEQ